MIAARFYRQAATTGLPPCPRQAGGSGMNHYWAALRPSEYT
jgi:hypothetical protein